MLELTHGLSTRQLDAIAELETRVVRHDGGRLKLEWGTLRARPQDSVNDVLWWDGDQLLGFLGIYRFGSATPELTGMVDPGARRDGIGSAMLDAAMPLVRGLGCERTLLVVPRVSVAGAELAAKSGMAFHHSEHALNLPARPAGGPLRAGLALRQAETGDLPELSRLFLDGFGSGEIDPHRPLRTERSSTLLVTLDHRIIGTLTTDLDETRAGVYGFVIDSEFRGQGIGAEALCRVCHELFDDGAERVHLEVEVQNDRALGLYLRLGFEPLATDDYYSLEL